MPSMTREYNYIRPSLEDIWRIRRDEMYPEKDLPFVRLAEDEYGHHLGIVAAGRLVSVVSLFADKDTLQFRKLATVREFRGRGYATALLQQVFRYAEENGFGAVWCNARTSAVQLYRRFGMSEEGGRWNANGHEYTKMINRSIKAIKTKTMEIIPAIDIIDGKCVRLTQGDYAQKTVYNENPLEVAKEFEAAGLMRLHLVDLDGAKAGAVKNWKVLEAIASRTSLVIDFGGGIKKEEDLGIVFNSGAALATIGSLAVKEEDKFVGWLGKYGADRFLLGADVKEEKIAVAGWLETTDIWIYDFIRKYLDHGVQQLFCTDVSKDGKLEGPSVELYRNILEKFPGLHFIASGGVSSMEDIIQLEALGCSGVILGKAIYEGRIQLRELVGR